MADKATLLQSLPPVEKKSSPTDPNQVGDEALAQAGTGTEQQPESSASISPFQAATYGSYILAYVIAGFAAVVLFRKTVDATKRRITNGAKILAGVFVLMAGHGFFASSSYINYLRNETDSAPLSLTILIWIILGGAAGYITNRLFDRKGKPERSGALFNAVFNGAIFAAITFAVSSDTNLNVALVVSLLAMIAYFVPLALFITTYNRLKYRRPVLQKTPLKLLLFGMVLFPAPLPLLALLYVFEAISADTTLLCINLINFGFILFVGLQLVICIKNDIGETVGETAGNELEPTEEAPAAPTSVASAPTKAAPAKPTMDPLVAELLAEQKEEERLAAEKAAAVQPVPQAFDTAQQKKPRPHTPKKLPKVAPITTKQAPPKPGAPKKPESLRKDADKAVPDVHPKIKAPIKPKKRF